MKKLIILALGIVAMLSLQSCGALTQVSNAALNTAIMVNRAKAVAGPAGLHDGKPEVVDPMGINDKVKTEEEMRRERRQKKNQN